MGITPLVFTGISKFSQDLQTIASRSAAIAALPVQALQNDQRDLLAQKSAFTDLKSAIGDFAASLSQLGSLGDTSSLGVSSSSSGIGASITSSSLARQGVYFITEVTSLATRASSTSTTGLASTSATPVAGPGLALQLLVGAQTFDVTLSEANNNLAGVRDAINALNAGVTASILNTGDPAAPYFLSLTAVSAGAQGIELRTTPGQSATNILTQTAPGSSASLKINGQAVTASSNTLENLIPGVTLTLHELVPPGETVTVSLDPSVQPLLSGLGAFVNAYNGLVAKLDAQTGEKAGALSGHGIVNGVRSELRALFGVATGAVAGLADLGVTVDNDGRMSLDIWKLSTASPARLRDVFTFLSASANGLGAIAPRLEQYSQPVFGLIDKLTFSFDETDRRLQAQIERISERINAAQASLLSQLQAADALLASLESQQGMLDAATQSLNFVLYGRKEQ